MKKYLLVPIGIAIIALVLFSQTSDEKTIATTDDKVHVAYFLNINHIVPIVGLEKGFFEIDSTEIEPRIFDSGPTVIESIFSGHTDIAYVGPGPAINGYVQSDGDGVRIIAGAASGGVSFVIPDGSNIHSVSDFDGKRVAAPSIGNTQDISLRTMIYEAGLKPKEFGGTVYVINADKSDIYTLFVKKEIDGVLMPEPHATVLVHDLNGTRLFKEEQMWEDGKFSSAVLIVRKQFMDENPQLVEQWLKGHIKTVNWINENKSESITVFDDYFKKITHKSIPRPVLEEAISNMEITYDPIEDSVNTVFEHAKSLRYIKKDSNIDGIFDLTLLHQLVK